MRDELRSLTLDQAIYWARHGHMTEDEFEAYAHLWQTSAPRFELRACQCAACVSSFPAPEYRSI